jgi:hypothetical protein
MSPFLLWSKMIVRKLNRPLFSLPDTHPARKFLEEFIACREFCVGKEIGTPSSPPVDQDWFSELEQKKWTLSAFAYSFLSFDVELDGWLSSAPQMTQSEIAALGTLPTLKILLSECERQAKLDENIAVLPLLARLNYLFDLWEKCILSRVKQS